MAWNALHAAAIAIALAAPPAAPIAQLGARPASEWIKTLERESRTAELKIDEVIARIGLRPGDMVADLGAGTGVFTRPFARAVNPVGKAYGVEIDRELVEYIDRRAREEGIRNVEAVLGQSDDPNLPVHNLDVAFFHDVLHHIKERELYLKRLATYLKPNGRIVVIDLVRGHEKEPEMQISVDDVNRWMDAAGFQPIQQIALFQDEFFVIYGRKS
jgi:cyclopropane fatty-acyl-phospholipid synthase-like methyltransferase